MILMKRKIRMVSFRVSEDEHEHLKHICVAEGARSISELARYAVHRLMDGAGSENDFSTGLQNLKTKVEELEREVKRLACFIERSSGDSGSTIGSANAS